ncbi:uroporphyrinogen decarboxylase family protein [Actinomycetota bacterium]
MIEYFNSSRYKSSKERLRKAFNFEIDDFREVPLILQTNSYWLTGHDPEEIPDDYFDNPQSMLHFQEEGIEEHLEKVDDDYIPYLMPWYGVALMSGAFGSKVIFPKKIDPSCASFSVEDLEDIGKLKMPDFEENFFTKKVLDTIRHFTENSDWPIAITDPQGTLATISLIVGYKNLFYWMNDHPDKIDELFDKVNKTLIEWVKVQKENSGEKIDQCNGAINVALPEGMGVWWADDDSVLLSPDMYERFVIPHYHKLFGSFGGGMMHWCGNSNHQLDNILNVKEIKAVHNYILGEVDDVLEVQNRTKEKRVSLVAGDIIPVEEELEGYLKEIKEKLDPRGLILQFTVSPKLGIKKGQYAETNRDVMKSAQRILKFFRG